MCLREPQQVLRINFLAYQIYDISGSMLSNFFQPSFTIDQPSTECRLDLSESVLK